MGKLISSIISYTPLRYIVKAKPEGTVFGIPYKIYNKFGMNYDDCCSTLNLDGIEYPLGGPILTVSDLEKEVETAILGDVAKKKFKKKRNCL